MEVTGGGTGGADGGLSLELWWPLLCIQTQTFPGLRTRVCCPQSLDNEARGTAQQGWRLSCTYVASLRLIPDTP